MDKNTVPENFTIALAVIDMIPVVLFGIASVLLWKTVGSPLILIGGLISFISGMLKVLWKFIVVICKKNVWPLFVQMRFGMSIGLLLIIAGFVVAGVTGKLGAFAAAFLQPLPIIMMAITVIGMGCMFYFAAKLDSSDVKANWTEQICNTIAQAAFLVMAILTGM